MTKIWHLINNQMIIVQYYKLDKASKKSCNIFISQVNLQCRLWHIKVTTRIWLLNVSLPRPFCVKDIAYTVVIIFFCLVSHCISQWRTEFLGHLKSSCSLFALYKRTGTEWQWDSPWEVELESQYGSLSVAGFAPCHWQNSYGIQDEHKIEIERTKYDVKHYKLISLGKLISKKYKLVDITAMPMKTALMACFCPA